MNSFHNILAAGMKDWSVKEWGAWYSITAGFITVTVSPFLWALFSHIKDLRNRADSAQKSAVDAQRDAAVANTNATNAQDGVVNANTRIAIVAALSTPAKVADGEKPATESTLKAVKDAVENHS